MVLLTLFLPQGLYWYYRLLSPDFSWMCALFHHYASPANFSIPRISASLVLASTISQWNFSSSQLETNMLPYNTFHDGAILCVPEHHNIMVTPTLKSKLFTQLRINDICLGSCAYHPYCLDLLKCHWNQHANSCGLLPCELLNARCKRHNIPLICFTQN